MQFPRPSQPTGSCRLRLYSLCRHPYVAAQIICLKTQSPEEQDQMRAETQNFVDEIKQGITLLRRHL